MVHRHVGKTHVHKIKISKRERVGRRKREGERGRDRQREREREREREDICAFGIPGSKNVSYKCMQEPWGQGPRHLFLTV